MTNGADTSEQIEHAVHAVSLAKLNLPNSIRARALTLAALGMVRRVQFMLEKCPRSLLALWFWAADWTSITNTPNIPEMPMNAITEMKSC